ncbi:MAG TPA: DNA polymerase IV [Clostridium sp.]|uniref:DNA polymerase IV n=1 Tax=Acetivibrio mesophilus TaxID=2487273 RepID=A0A4Q0I4S5_9FIRM|nr:DNA polymerase IV [Acetivibrio mesophilus]ODM26820.1 DNA polymerase IV [Clostridium sp. Bc-iso-3]RXE59313.1 DNA polymerase IV [Acetivibrio mesophilus]HHV28389.1 DNA polymerase IV [Clostridium sp.]
MKRVILHCDLNNFYASVECLYNPELRDRPVAVCGSVEDRHGIVLAKNYEAKKYKVMTGETVWEAKSKCPGLVTVRANHSLYLKFSRYARQIYEYYTDQIESFGLDECWMDVSESSLLFGDGPKIANEIRKKIKRELGVTVSIGVSYNKIFAKLGSDMKKPDAVTVITEDNFKEKIWGLPVEDLLYVGRSTRRKLNNLAIFTIGDLANCHLEFLIKQLGKWGYTLWNFANGYDTSPVARNDCEIAIKSIGNSLTTPRDLTNNEDVRILIYTLSESVGERLRSHNLKGRTVQISLKDPGLQSLERQGQLDLHTYITSEIAAKAYEIFLKSWDWSKNIRALGVRVTDLVEADTCTQISLFLDDAKRQKLEMIDECVDRVRERFGHYSVQRGILLQYRD